MLAVCCVFPGDYEVSVKFNDQHIPDSPYLVPVVAAVHDARRLALTGLQVRQDSSPRPAPRGHAQPAVNHHCCSCLPVV